MPLGILVGQCSDILFSLYCYRNSEQIWGQLSYVSFSHPGKLDFSCWNEMLLSISLILLFNLLKQQFVWGNGKRGCREQQCIETKVRLEYLYKIWDLLGPSRCALVQVQTRSRDWDTSLQQTLCNKTSRINTLICSVLSGEEIAASISILFWGLRTAWPSMGKAWKEGEIHFHVKVSHRAFKATAEWQGIFGYRSTSRSSSDLLGFTLMSQDPSDINNTHVL